MRHIIACIALLLATYSSATPTSCPNCAAWNADRKPFRIFGNTYYVGVDGLSSILIASHEGHVLIDGALPESPAKIVASIRSLGFRIEDVKLIVNSHVHYDHAGGIAELQRLSQADVAASASSAQVLRRGGVGRDDPQYGTAMVIEPVARVKVIQDKDVLRVGSIKLTAHFTPGHTPGGTSWTWKSCEKSRCLDIVYADSVAAVSSENFLFSRSSEYPNALQDFEKSFATLSALPCAILLTPHPGASNIFGRLQHRDEKGSPDAFVDASACQRHVTAARDGLRKRIDSENISFHSNDNARP